MNWCIILVSPKGAGNVGGIARLMGNFGFRDLRIVAPRCDLESLECKQMSMASYDIIQEAKIFSQLSEAQADRTLSFAFSGKKSEDGRPRLSFFDFINHPEISFRPDDRIALVYGREEWGLRLNELDQCDRVIEIPTSEEKPSINLTSAAAITLGVLFQKVQCASKESLPLERPTKRNEEIFFKRVRNLLDLTKFLNPQNPEQNLNDFRAIYHRAELSDRDLRILFGALSGFEEALGMNVPKIVVEKMARKKS